MKPCPHCNNPDVELVYGNDAYVQCPRCGLQGPGHRCRGSSPAEHIDRERALRCWDDLPRKETNADRNRKD